MRLSQLYLALLIVTFFSCGKQASTAPSKGKIVLIFNKAPENYRYQFPNGISTNNGGFDVKYFDDNLIPHLVLLKQNVSDTIFIETQQNIIEIQHAYHGADRLSFFISKGDTIVVNYREELPIATLKRADYLSNGLNFESLARQLVYKGDFPSSIKFHAPFAFHQFSPNSFANDYKTVEGSFKAKAFTEYVSVDRLLDSLLSRREIDAASYKFFKLKNKYNAIAFGIRSSGVHPEHWLLNDTLLNYPFYLDFLETVVTDFYAPRSGKIEVGNAVVPDYNAIYDSIAQSRLYSQKTQSILLRFALREIIASGNLNSIKKYSAAFIHFTSDSLALRSLLGDGVLDFESSKLELVDKDGHQINLNELLKSFRGKLVYVDFWASWCGPCIGQFPYAKQLEEQFLNDKVVFLYLSTDSDSTKWIKASRKHRIHNGYLIKNRLSKILLNEMKVTTIPRYMLFGKKGELINSNAPRPSDPTINNILRDNL